MLSWKPWIMWLKCLFWFIFGLMVTTHPFLCLLENQISAQTGRTCKYFQLIPPFYWNGAMIIAKCGLLLFISSFFVELHLSRWNKWFTNHTQSANDTGKNGLWRVQLAEFAGFRPDFQHRHVGLGPRLNHPKGRTGCLLHLMINTALFYRGALQFIRFIYLLIYLFRNRVPSVPRNHRGSCSVLADRAFWASLRRARIWVYSALIIKLPPFPHPKRKTGCGESPDKCECCWPVLPACGAGDFSPPCGRLAPGQGACVVSPNGADTCTNIKALAVRACKYHPENLGDDAKIGNQLYFEINGRNYGFFF